MSPPKFLSMDGRLTPYAEAQVHVLAPAITYGATVFEGVRGYWSAARQDCLLFRLDDHLERLAFSIRVRRFQFIFSQMPTPAIPASSNCSIIPPVPGSR